jgi:hypothetical protein
MNVYSRAIATLGLDANTSQPTLLALFALLVQGLAVDQSPPTTGALLLARLQVYVGASSQARELLAPLVDVLEKGQLK